MSRSLFRYGVISILALTAAGCSVGPNYHRPAVSVPQTYRSTPAPEAAAAPGPAPTASASAPSAPPAAASFGDEKWWEVFQDQQLQALIRTALKQNYDVRLAAARILEAQAQVSVARGNQFPSAGLIVAGNDSRQPKSSLFRAFNTSYNELALGFQWDVDFWGKYRRASEAARAELLANQWAQKQVTSSLVASVASAYFVLRAEDLQLHISQRTLGSYQDSLRLTRLLVDHGATSMLDVRQAEQLVFNDTGSISTIEKEIAQQENLISILLGQDPGEVARGLELNAQPRMPQVPAGLPSSLLERRPDIREAEGQLMAANANIGVAKAAYFPDINLTGVGGFQSIPLSQLFAHSYQMWNFTGQLAQPLYAGGSIRGRLNVAKAQEEEAELHYRQTVQQAFREVSDALVAYQKDHDFVAQQQLLAYSAKDASRLSDLRYRGGASSYLEVLDSDTRTYAAELTLVEAQLREMQDYIQLYHVLGGGWQE